MDVCKGIPGIPLTDDSSESPCYYTGAGSCQRHTTALAMNYAPRRLSFSFTGTAGASVKGFVAMSQHGADVVELETHR